MRTRWAYTIVAMFYLGASAMASAAPLQYQFKGDPIVYRITAVLDEPDHPTVTTAYLTITAKPDANGQFALACRIAQSTQPGREGSFTPMATFFNPVERTSFTVDPNGKPGKVVTPLRGALPAAVGDTALVVLPQLATDGAQTWKTNLPQVVTRTTPSPIGAGAPANITQATGNRTDDYTAGPAEGDAVPVNYTTDMTVAGDKFDEHLTGSGSFSFDTRRGLLRTLSANYTVDGKFNGVQHTAQLKLDAVLLSAAEVKALHDSAQVEKDRLVAGRAQRDAAAPEKAVRRPHGKSDQLPPGTETTESVGGEGGGKFLKVDSDLRPVIGFRLKMGNWDGHKMVGEIEPLFETPTDLHPTDQTLMLAKDGYAVAGLWVNGTDMANAIRVIYMKQTPAGTLDTKDAYVGPWFGQIVGDTRIKLGATGKPVVGVFGHQGMNTDALGLVMRSAEAGKTGDPTDDPNFKGTGGK